MTTDVEPRSRLPSDQATPHLEAELERARAAVDWQKAVEVLSSLIAQARAAPRDPAAEYGWRSEREQCYERLALIGPQFQDIEAMVALADELDDGVRRVHAACRRMAVLLQLGRIDEVTRPQ